MIRINLLPVEKKKKKKPVPAFLIAGILVMLVAVAVMAYLFYYYNTTLEATTMKFKANEQKMAELKKKINEVDNFEKLNKTVDERNKLIEQLRKNQNLPVMLIDEISKSVPSGVWMSAMTSTGSAVNIDGYAFTNADVVVYINNLKASALFSEISLQESKQTEMEKIPLYQFKLTFNVKG